MNLSELNKVLLEYNFPYKSLNFGNININLVDKNINLEKIIELAEYFRLIAPLYIMFKTNTIISFWKLQCNIENNKYKIDKLLVNKNSKYIFIFTSIMYTKNIGHANMLTYNVSNKELERFEPRGKYTTSIQMYEENIDNLIIKATKILKYKTYKKPSQFIKNPFQIETIEFSGYCEFWCYLYMFIKVYDLDINIFHDKLLKFEKENDISRVDFIKGFTMYMKEYLHYIVKQALLIPISKYITIKFQNILRDKQFIECLSHFESNTNKWEEYYKKRNVILITIDKGQLYKQLNNEFILIPKEISLNDEYKTFAQYKEFEKTYICLYYMDYYKEMNELLQTKNIITKLILYYNLDGLIIKKNNTLYFEKFLE